LGEDASVEGAELGGAVVDVGSGHGELGGREQGSRTGSKEASFAEHGGFSLAAARFEATATITEYTSM
jgi:hypothetical protein